MVDKVIKAPLGTGETRYLEPHLDLRSSPIVTVKCSSEPQNSRAKPNEVNWDDEPRLRLREEGCPLDQAVSSPNNDTTADLGRHSKPFHLWQMLGNWELGNSLVKPYGPFYLTLGRKQLRSKLLGGILTIFRFVQGNKQQQVFIAFFVLFWFFFKITKTKMST